VDTKSRVPFFFVIALIHHTVMDMKHSHSLVVMYDGYSPTKDAKIRKLIGGDYSGGGFGFGVRDLFFDCKSKKDATEKVAKLKGMNVRTSIRRIA
jgi:hypothetical protein